MYTKFFFIIFFTLFASTAELVAEANEADCFSSGHHQEKSKPQYENIKNQISFTNELSATGELTDPCHFEIVCICGLLLSEWYNSTSPFFLNKDHPFSKNIFFVSQYLNTKDRPPTA